MPPLLATGLQATGLQDYKTSGLRGYKARGLQGLWAYGSRGSNGAKGLGATGLRGRGNGRSWVVSGVGVVAQPREGVGLGRCAATFTSNIST